MTTIVNSRFYANCGLSAWLVLSHLILKMICGEDAMSFVGVTLDSPRASISLSVQSVLEDPWGYSCPALLGVHGLVAREEGPWSGHKP